MEIQSKLFTPVQSIKSNQNNYSNTTLNLIQDKKMQIHDKISEIQKSDLSDKIKNEKIKELQEQLVEIEKQELREQAKKLVEGNKDKDVNQKSEQEDDENVGLINENVMMGLISSSAHLEKGDVAYSVYKKAKSEGDIAKMKRATSYIVPELQKSLQSTTMVKKGLKEYKDQIKKEKDTSKTDKTTTDSTINEANTDDGIENVAEIDNTTRVIPNLKQESSDTDNKIDLIV